MPRQSQPSGRLPGAGSPGSMGKCVVCGEEYSLRATGDDKPEKYTKNNKKGYAHTRCIKQDKPNAPLGEGQGERGK